MTIRGRDILMNAMVIFVTSLTGTASVRRGTPNLRIALAVALVGVRHNILRQAGSRQRRKSRRTRSHPPPSAGATIVYAAIGASDALGIGSSVPCLPFIDCPDGTGYVQVAARQLRAQGFPVTVSNLGVPTAVIGRDFERSASSTTGRSSATSSIRNCRWSARHHPGHHLRRRQRGQHHHRRAGRRRGRRRSGRLHRSTGGGIRRRLRHAAAGHPQPGGRQRESSS